MRETPLRSSRVKPSRTHARTLALIGLLAASAVGQTTVTFQPAPGTHRGDPNFCRATQTRFTTATQSPTAWTNEGQELYVKNSPGIAFVDFPFLVGSGPGQIPPGARIVSATLELWATRATGSTGRLVFTDIEAAAVLDPDRLGTWHEPASPGMQARETGVTYVERDARLRAQIPWDNSGLLRPTTNESISEPLLPASTNPTVRINRYSPQPAGTHREGEWHPFDVTEHVRYWVQQGRSNQGWMLESSGSHEVWYASDEFANSTRRPRLRVTWDTPTSPAANRVPNPGRLLPSRLELTQATDLAFLILPVDPDGGTPEVVITEEPQHGELARVGTLAAWNYRPGPEFTGSDEFTYIVRDGVSTSFPVTIPITVFPRPGQITRVFQEGVSPAGRPSFGRTKFAGTHNGPQPPGSGTTFAEEEFRVRKADSSTLGLQGFLEFPELIGSEAERIPAGSRIVSAELQITTSRVPSGVDERRVVEMRRVLDPFAGGFDWVEIPGVLAGGSAQGIAVSYLYPDESVAPQNPWHIPGGNAHPGEGSTAATTRETDEGDALKFDVTRAVQAWANGAPNLGWVARAAEETQQLNSYWSDDAPIPTDRPRLVVNFLPPGTSAGPWPVAPHADAGPDQVVHIGEEVTLDGRGAVEPLNPGASPQVVWIQTGGPPVSLSSTTAMQSRFTAPLTPTELRFFLGAVSPNGSFSGDEMRITVLDQPGGSPVVPVRVDAGPPRTGDELRAMSLQGTILDGGSQPLTVRWTQLAGPTVIEAAGFDTLTPNFRLPPVGSGGANLLFDLTVSETHPSGYVSRHRDEVSIRVLSPSNGRPVARAGTNIDAEPGEWVELDATSSTDPDNHPLLFRWRQVSGPAVNIGRYIEAETAEAGIAPFQVPLGAGAVTLEFEVTVTDRERSDVDRVRVAIQPPPTPWAGSITNRPLDPYRTELHPEEARHLLRRMGAGWHPDDVAVVRATGLSTVVDAALNASYPAPGGGTYHTPMEVIDEAYNYAPFLVGNGVDPPHLNQPQIDTHPQFVPRQGTAAWLVHTLRSPNFLRERIARFWHRRFSVSVRNLRRGRRQWVIPHLEGFRDRALGTYPDLLLWFSRDPVTLSFIEGFDNLRFAPNENYGREFLELYSLGVFDPQGQPIFNQADIEGSSRAFTGWRPACYGLHPTNPDSCYPAFVTFFHDDGVKSVLGFQGNFDDAAMTDLVTRDYQGGMAAARHLARDMLDSFVMARPPQSLVDDLANAMLAENWDLNAIFRRLLTSRAMFAPEARKSIMKAPVEFANGIVRTLRIPLQTTDIASSSELPLMFRRCAEELMNPLDVDGWADDTNWIAEELLLQRFNFIEELAERAEQPTAPRGGDMPGFPAQPVDFVPDWLPPSKARGGVETVELLSRLLDVELARTPAPGAAQAPFDLVVEYIDTRATAPAGTPPGSYQTDPDPFDGDDPASEEKLLGLFVLLLEHPEFQRL